LFSYAIIFGLLHRNKEEFSVNTELASIRMQQTDLRDLKQRLQAHIIGQDKLIDRLLIALLADGHLLVEGAPGLAKTKSIKALAQAVEGSFQRIQFTPDLLPGDITGTEIYRAETGRFEFQPGPIFHHLILADEINRAPAKVQSALLEAMEERQVTVAGKTHVLPPLFLVMATQNPIEQEGTYPLPEAQLDRFLMYVKIHYPDLGAEKKILQLNRKESKAKMTGVSFNEFVISQAAIQRARQALFEVHLSESLENYLIEIVMATRTPGRYHEKLGHWLRYGASPRATIALDKCARAHAWLQGRDYVCPEDIHAIVYDVLRHRILLNFEAEAQGIDTDQFIMELLMRVSVP
jgi:MoxR-like ATPase